MRVISSQLTQNSLVGAEDSSQFLFVQLFALAKELHFSLSSWKNGIKNSMQLYFFLELPFGFHINGQVCHMSVGIVEHSILQYVLQYGFAVLQYIAIRFLPYCCTPIENKENISHLYKSILCHKSGLLKLLGKENSY